MQLPKVYTLRGSRLRSRRKCNSDSRRTTKVHISVIQLDDIKHGDMDNKGKREQHDTILYYLYKFLK